MTNDSTNLVGFYDLKQMAATNGVITLTNIVNDHCYDLLVAFTNKDSSTPKITSINKHSSLADLVVTNVLAGENVVLESVDNLINTNWTPCGTNYIGMTYDNFGVPTSTTFTNVDASATNRFYRAKVQ